ncbi:MAG TPA: S53 family peptidase [Candidatus Sulfotelmatobacter sp.]|nr:S53 family peptidase [Candidatus Sulfotelmatobacter sp.]
MIRRLSAFFLAMVALVSGASVVGQAEPQALLTRHVREVTQTGQAQSLGRLPGAQTLRFDIVLPLRDPAGLDAFLQELYDPASSIYRHFLTVQEFTERFGPSQDDYDELIRFAQRSGFAVVGGSRDSMDLQLQGTVSAIESSFHVTLGLYQHPSENRTFFAPDREPTVDLPFQLWHISGLDNYSIPRAMLSHRDTRVRSNAVKGSCPGGYYCGSDMRAAYLGSSSLTGTGQNIALLELAGTDLADLTTYYTNVGQTKPYTPTLVSTGGYSTTCLNSGGCQDTEQTLDMTQAMSMAPGSTMLYMYVCGDGSSFSETACLSAMSTATPLSMQIGCSWSWNPADPATDDPYYKKFATQGQNFFTASGDSGSYPNSTGFYYPAEDAFVTAVGGTDLQVAGAGGPWSSETAWSSSGGGISPDSIAIPAWQQLTGVINSSNKGSKTLRNIPDVSAEANFDFYVCSDQSGCAGGWGGTSFAAPMWAGFMALVNQQALANGNPVLGFINPAVYNIGVGSGYGAAFHDITSGGNGGFPAVTGYDLVTGWGSPNGVGLINALAGTTSSPSFTISASPTSVSVVQGKNGTSTITTAISGGFDAAITLSATGQPTGVTVGFSPNPIAAPGSSTSTMTMTVGSTTATGTYTITVTGVGGGVTQTTTVSLTVTSSSSADFTIGASPTAITVAQGTTGTSTITTAVLGSFNSAITLSASGQGGAQKVTFSPNPIAAPGSGTSTMTVKVGKTAFIGKHTITIKGTGGGKTHTTTVILTVIK